MEKQYEQEEYEKSFMLCGFMLLLCGCSFSGEQEVKERKAGLTQTEPESTKTINTEFDGVPVEYKRGEPQKDDVDILQLTAQALCLEEMLCCRIPGGYLYYGETRRRKKIDLTRRFVTKQRIFFWRCTSITTGAIHQRQSGPEAVMPVPSRISAFQCLAGMKAPQIISNEIWRERRAYEAFAKYIICHCS